MIISLICVLGSTNSNGWNFSEALPSMPEFNAFTDSQNPLCSLFSGTLISKFEYIVPYRGLLWGFSVYANEAQAAKNRYFMELKPWTKPLKN